MSRVLLVALALLICAALCVQSISSSTLDLDADRSEWDCTVLVHKVKRPGIEWQRLNCTGVLPSGEHLGPLVFNVATADLSTPGIRVVPAQADPAKQLQNLADMSTQIPNVVLGVNGGYFWRVDSKSFIDDVCFLKSRSEALEKASAEHPNYGIGDGLMVVNGTLLSSNCDCLGYARPTALIIDGQQSRIEVMHRGAPAPPGVLNAIAAGPNLVSVGQDGVPVVDIPFDDHNVNIWEHSSNTAVGLIRHEPCPDPNHCNLSLVMVVSDGHDECHRSDPTCGLEAKPMAYFMKDLIGATVAMEMDQGGSSTMLVAGEGTNGIVSNPTRGTRNLYNGLFVAVD